MKALARKIKRFIHDDSGLETLEIAAIAAGTVILIGIIVEIYDASSDKIEEAADSIVK